MAATTWWSDTFYVPTNNKKTSNIYFLNWSVNSWNINKSEKSLPLIMFRCFVGHQTHGTPVFISLYDRDFFLQYLFLNLQVPHLAPSCARTWRLNGWASNHPGDIGRHQNMHNESQWSCFRNFLFLKTWDSPWNPGNCFFWRISFSIWTSQCSFCCSVGSLLRIYNFNLWTIQTE